MMVWSRQNCREVVTMSRRTVRGGEVEVTELVPKWRTDGRWEDGRQEDGRREDGRREDGRRE
eukprot:437671-Prymnesium_polylepis.1